MNPINVTKVDHIHRYTSDKWLAAKWYKEMFNFEIMSHLKAHAESSEKAPLDIINKSGNIIFALFTTKNPADMDSTSTIAMRVDTNDFMALINSADDMHIKMRNGATLSDKNIIFHKPSHDISVYFVDPWGNSIEIITSFNERLGQAYPQLNSLYEKS